MIGKISLMSTLQRNLDQRQIPVRCTKCAVAKLLFIYYLSPYTLLRSSGGMHSPTAIRFYEINTPLTEAVLPDGRNYKTILSLCYQLL
jgi:hypothetical protein